jgi:hypothetical protein
MKNAYFYIESGSLTPTLDAALIDGEGKIVNLQGATVVFSLYNLGGTLRFSQAATIVDDEAGHVRYTWTSGQVPSVAGRYLGRFRVTYSNLDQQNFPSDRYIEVVVT